MDKNEYLNELKKCRWFGPYKSPSGQPCFYSFARPSGDNKYWIKLLLDFENKEISLTYRMMNSDIAPIKTFHEEIGTISCDYKPERNLALAEEEEFTPIIIPEKFTRESEEIQKKINQNEEEARKLQIILEEKNSQESNPKKSNEMKIGKSSDLSQSNQDSGLLEKKKILESLVKYVKEQFDPNWKLEDFTGHADSIAPSDFEDLSDELHDFILERSQKSDWQASKNYFRFKSSIYPTKKCNLCSRDFYQRETVVTLPCRHLSCLDCETLLLGSQKTGQQSSKCENCTSND